MDVLAFQCSSSENISGNMREAVRSLKKIKGTSPDLTLFPENFLSHGNYDSIRQNARSLTDWGKLFQKFLDESGHKGLVVWGTVPLRRNGKIFNSSIVTLPGGEILCVYEKVHLFSCRMGSLVSETALYSPGNEAIVFDFKGWRIGLSVCFDLRFPRHFSDMKFPHLILCPSAFTKKTGALHWELLLRARAVENQAYILAANQRAPAGKDFPETYGKSMIIDPLGEIICRAPERSHAQIRAQLDMDKIAETRKMIDLGA